MTEIKRGFVRGLWGIHDHQGRRYYLRRTKIDNDIRMASLNKNEQPFFVYVFGEDNYKFLVDNGFNCKMLDKRPIIWDMDTQQFRHKIEVMKVALEENDNIVFLDWDCQAIKPIPDYFWDVLEKKAPIQAPLRAYRNWKIQWREGNRLPEASFIYIRDKSIGEQLVKLWSELNCPWSEEAVVAKFMDNYQGGWKGVEEYWKIFEPDFRLTGPGKFPPPDADKKEHLYNHFNARGVGKILGYADSQPDKSEALTKYVRGFELPVKK